MDRFKTILLGSLLPLLASCSSPGLCTTAGDAEAQFNLAWKYANGEGVPENDAEAVKWYRRSADQGNADAQYNLAVMYANGEGVPEDDAEAVTWFRRSAEQGYTKAQFNLGVMYANGEGVPENNVFAHKWLNLAKVGGDENAGNVLEIIIPRMTKEQIAEAQ